MKKILFLLAFSLVATLGLHAQKDFPANVRIDVSEVTNNNAKYSIFLYKDDDGTVGYYMSLGGASEIFSISIKGAGNFAIEDVRETCLWLGATTDEAFASLDSLLALYEMEAGTVKEFQGRSALGFDRLQESNITTCQVKKKLLGGKRLLFTFTSGSVDCGVYLNKGIVKQLRFGLKTNIKINPKYHR